MKLKGLGVYTIIWIIAMGILTVSLFQNVGYARVINYSGIVRGATQKLIKKEIARQPDDELIQYLDDILYSLQTGKGNYDLVKLNSKDYQGKLSEMQKEWEEIKAEINKVRAGQSYDRLYKLSEDYFQKANNMVASAERYSNYKIKLLIISFFVYLVITISVFLFWYRLKRNQLHKVMYKDDLTDIWNQNAFELAFSKILENRQAKQLAILYFDIDDFKFINNTYGYTYGDELLKIIAKTIMPLGVGERCCARSNADNFYLLVEYDTTIVEQIKEKLIADIQNYSQLAIAQDLTFCFGAYFIDNNREIHDIMDNVNLAHKNAKSLGSDSIVWYDENFMKKLQDEKRLIKRMHKALEEEEFTLYLQPKFRMEDTGIMGAEALVRWQFPDGSIKYPDSFIPLFEKNGSIYELDFYMLRKTCQFIKEHRLDDKDFRISVNFSRVTIYRKNFYQQLLQILEQWKVPECCLEIEITESVFNDLSQSIVSMLEKLRDRGFFISVDDFGTGYSSLSLLNVLPIDVLKIDRAFLISEKNWQNMKTILELIVQVAHTLGMTVICEGVETKDQHELLNELGCDYGQGYYISKPVDADTFSKRFFQTLEKKMEWDHLYKAILNEDDSYIYVANPLTYDLMFINKSTLRLYHLPEDDVNYKGKKCYRLLQGMDQPCPFCTNRHLTTHDFYEWEHYNPVLQRYFAIRDKIIVLDGTPLRLEIAADITDTKSERAKLENELRNQSVMIETIKKLSANAEQKNTILELLQNICKLYDGERGYIFEFDYEKELCSNTYEWCKEGINSEIDKLQELPLSVAARWREGFESKGELYIESLGSVVREGSLEYDLLHMQGITSLIAVPLLKEGVVCGFLGIDNPKKFSGNLSVLKSVAHFYMNEMKKMETMKRLQRMSSIDQLTQVYNRNEYASKIEKLKQKKELRLGIVYLDLNGLKAINDTYGHDTGDKVIKQMTDVLWKVFPECIYRIGGDEFVVLEEKIAKGAFEKKVLQLRQAVDEQRDLSVSIGRRWVDDADSIDQMIAEADNDMYAEKQLYYAEKTKH